MAYDTSKLASLQALKDTATRIKKEYLAAISKAGHASFQKAEAIIKFVPTMIEELADAQRRLVAMHDQIRLLVWLGKEEN